MYMQLASKMAGRRRQILQLEGGIGRSDSGGKTSKSKLQSHPANSLLGMMSSYHSDDEDDHMVDSEDKVVEETESSRVTLETTGSKQSQLDEQVADFLQAIATCDEPASSPPREADSNDCNKTAQLSNEALDEGQEEMEGPSVPLGDSQPSSSMWVACVDSNSGYTYYWNKQTNEVSWTLPEGVELASSAGVESDGQNTTTMDEKTESVQACDEVMGSPHTSDQEDGDTVEHGPQSPSSSVLVTGEVDVAVASQCETVAEQTELLTEGNKAPNSCASKDADSTEPRTCAEAMVGGALVGYHTYSGSDEDSDIDNMLDQALTTDDSALDLCEDRKGVKRQADVIEEDETARSKKLKESESKQEKEEGIEDPGPDEDRAEQLDRKEEEDVKDEITEKTVDHIEQNSKVAVSCKELSRRLTLLGAATAGVHPLILELVRLEARTTDWQNGALTAEYFVQRLQETTQLLADYEALVPPPGWTYVWDSDFERYYFYNSVTDKASWDYPTTDPPQEEGNTALSTVTSVTSQDACASAPTTPPQNIDFAATPPSDEGEWQGPPPPPPPLEDGEVPPSPPTPPAFIEQSEAIEDDGACDAEESYQLEAGPQLYYGPQALPPEALTAHAEDSTPSGSRNASPAPEESEPKKKKKKAVKVNLHGRKGKAVSSLLQKWAGLHEGKS